MSGTGPTSRPEAIAELTAAGGRFELAVEPVRGAPLQVYKTRSRSLREHLLRAESFGARDCLVQGPVRYTYTQAASRMRSAAASMAELGVAKGERVALLAANSPDWAIGFWATVSLGAISVPLNAWWKVEELEFVLGDCEPVLLLCDRRRYEVIAPLIGKLGLRVAVFGDDVPAQALSFEQLAVAQPEAPWCEDEIEEDDYCAILYTSGTTGRPKGSIQTHRTTIANLMNMTLAGRVTAMVAAAAKEAAAAGDAEGGAKAAGAKKERPQNCWLAVVPFFHVTGLNAIVAAALTVGGKIVMMPPGRFDPDAAIDAIAGEKVTVLTCVPTVMTRMLEARSLSSDRLRSLKTVSYGGAPPPRELVARVAEVMPWISGGGPSTVYGLTETAAVMAMNSGEDYRRKPDSCGRPVPTVEVRIVAADGRDAATGERGEIWTRGPTVSPGYWRRPDENAETFTDGWFHTGDIGKLDEEGFLYILDRAKDMIIRGGENIYSIEIEDVLEQHPGVLECAVVGVPHEHWGEEVKAVVVTRDGAGVGVEELRAHCAEHLAHYKVPAYLELRSEALPRNPAGKVLKSALRGDSHAFDAGADSDSAL